MAKRIEFKTFHIDMIENVNTKLKIEKNENVIVGIT